MVPIIIFYLKKSLHWSVWPSVVLCLIGGYLLTNFYDATVRLGDALGTGSIILEHTYHFYWYYRYQIQSTFNIRFDTNSYSSFFLYN